MSINMDFSDVEPTCWLYDAAYISKVWHYCSRKNCILMPWDLLKDYSQYESQTDIEKRLKKVYKQPNKDYFEESLAIWNFYHKMKIGDIVFVKEGDDRIIACGYITGDYQFSAQDNSYKNRRSVKWEYLGDIRIELPKSEGILLDLTGYPELISVLKNDVKEIKWISRKSSWVVLVDPSVCDVSALKTEDQIIIPLYRATDNGETTSRKFNRLNIGDKLIVYDFTVKKLIAEIECIQKLNGRILVGKILNTYPIYLEEILQSENIEIQKMDFFVNPKDPLTNLTITQYDCLIGEMNQLKTKINIKPYTRTDFLDEVFMKEEDLDRLERLLRRKKNIILQGAPGVGKTFSAKRLAYLMMRRKDDSRIEMVQFHQSYSYEDFIMGYKPTEDGGFALNDGIFYEFCTRAAADPDKDYFFIIDEINRGNLSKIFGELFQLIEADYRNKPIHLAYKKDELFCVPDNIYIIGMMNTADRSLAMMDYALRRRFSFFAIEPGFDTIGFRRYSESLCSRHHRKLVEAVKRVNDMILGDDSLGKGFLIGHSYLIPNLVNKNGSRLVFDREMAESIIEFDIVPLIEEYWFDDENKVINAKEILRKVVKDDD